MQKLIHEGTGILYGISCGTPYQGYAVFLDGPTVIYTVSLDSPFPSIPIYDEKGAILYNAPGIVISLKYEKSLSVVSSCNPRLLEVFVFCVEK